MLQLDMKHYDTAVAVVSAGELSRIDCTEQLESEQLEPVHRLGESAREGRLELKTQVELLGESNVVQASLCRDHG